MCVKGLLPVDAILAALEAARQWYLLEYEGRRADTCHAERQTHETSAPLHGPRVDMSSREGLRDPLLLRDESAVEPAYKLG